MSNEEDFIKEFFNSINEIKDSKAKKKKQRCDWPGCKNLALINIENEEGKRQTCKKHLIMWFDLTSRES